MGFLFSFCRLCDIPLKSVPRYFERLQKDLDHKDWEKAFWAAHTLATDAPDTPGLVAAVLRRLKEANEREKQEAGTSKQKDWKDTAGPERWNLVYVLGQLGPRAASATRPLMEMMTVRAVEPGKIVVMDGKQGLPLNERIVQTLRKIGPGAAEALPLLEGIQEYAELRNVVREAIAKIKGTPPEKPKGESKTAPRKGESKTATPAARG